MYIYEDNSRRFWPIQGGEERITASASYRPGLPVITWNDLQKGRRHD